MDPGGPKYGFIGRVVVSLPLHLRGTPTTVWKTPAHTS